MDKQKAAEILSFILGDLIDYGTDNPNLEEIKSALEVAIADLREAV